MDFVSNLNFAEIMFRYAIMIVIGIVAGVLHQYWMIAIVMAIFMEAIMGYCPIKAMFTKKAVKH